MPRHALTRRDVLKGAVGAAALATAPAQAARTRDRVAVIGAGAGGVAAAYFLAGTHDVDVFEARSRIGGHCDSRVVRHGGRRIAVDLGAQFFHPDTHPVYVTLLEEVGLLDDVLEAPGSLRVFPTAGGPAAFSSQTPFATPGRAIEFALFTQFARWAVTAGIAWETSVAEWIRDLALSQDFKDAVLYPWITATIGCSRPDAERASARSILQTFALAFPADLTKPATTLNSSIGLQGNLQRLLNRAQGARVHVRSPVRALARTRAGWFLRTPSGRRGPFKFVVLNAPPRIGRDLLRPLDGFEEATALLDEYRYFDSRLLVHTDPAYVGADRSTWAAYNAGVDGRRCEGSVWLGAFHERLPSGATVDVFKSWAQRRRTDPSDVLFERRFKHPHITRSTIEAARALARFQGRRGLYFSGQYTTGMDLQESAVYSAMQVAAALAPRSRTLVALQDRLRERGREGISYAL